MPFFNVVCLFIIRVTVNLILIDLVFSPSPPLFFIAFVIVKVLLLFFFLLDQIGFHNMYPFVYKTLDQLNRFYGRNYTRMLAALYWKIVRDTSYCLSQKALYC